jgi:hypothetical protein
MGLIWGTDNGREPWIGGRWVLAIAVAFAVWAVVMILLDAWTWGLAIAVLAFWGALLYSMRGSPVDPRAGGPGGGVPLRGGHKESISARKRKTKGG